MTLRLLSMLHVHGNTHVTDTVEVVSVQDRKVVLIPCDVMLLNPLGTRPLDNLADAIDAVISEIDRQHAIHSIIDVEHDQDEYVVSTLITFVADQEAVVGNKIVHGENDHDVNGINDEAPEEAS
jgi:hypothetical protein